MTGDGQKDRWWSRDIVGWTRTLQEAGLGKADDASPRGTVPFPHSSGQYLKGPKSEETKERLGDAVEERALHRLGEMRSSPPSGFLLCLSRLAQKDEQKTAYWNLVQVIVGKAWCVHFVSHWGGKVGVPYSRNNNHNRNLAPTIITTITLIKTVTVCNNSQNHNRNHNRNGYRRASPVACG